MRRKKIPLKVRKALASGNVRQARIELGEFYSIQGSVDTGNQLGRTLGYPTANLKPNEDSPLFLANGVYAVKVRHHKIMYKGMANIGIRPTMEQHELTIEVNLFDFNEDLYGHKITIYFIERIRDELKFPDLDALKMQISKDKEQILELFRHRNHSDSDPT